MRVKLLGVLILIFSWSIIFCQQKRVSYDIEITNLSLNGNPIRNATFYVIRDGLFFKSDTLKTDSLGILRFEVKWIHIYIPGSRSSKKSLIYTVDEYIILQYANSGYFRFVKNKFWKYGYRKKGVYKVKVIWPIKVPKDYIFTD